jgi:hypothetical protein
MERSRPGEKMYTALEKIERKKKEKKKYKQTEE